MLNGSEALFPSVRDELFIAKSVNPICPICPAQTGFIPPAQTGCGWMPSENVLLYHRWCCPLCSWGCNVNCTSLHGQPTAPAFCSQPALGSRGERVKWNGVEWWDKCAFQWPAHALQQRNSQQAPRRAVCKLDPPAFGSVLGSRKIQGQRVPTAYSLLLWANQSSFFKTQTLIGYFLGKGSQYIPHLVGLIVLCMLRLDWCCEPRKRSRRSLLLQISLLGTTVVVGLPDTWLLQWSIGHSYRWAVWRSERTSWGCVCVKDGMSLYGQDVCNTAILYYWLGFWPLWL